MYLPFYDWFWTKRTYVWFKINRKMINTIWFRYDLSRFRKYFSVCIPHAIPNKIRLTIAWEASAFRHHGVLIKAPTTPLLHITSIRYQWASVGPQLNPLKPKGFSTYYIIENESFKRYLRENRVLFHLILFIILKKKLFSKVLFWVLYHFESTSPLFFYKVCIFF